MRLTTLIAAALLASTVTTAAAAPFFGTRRNNDLVPPDPAGRCAPLPTVSIGPGFSGYFDGTSNFGAFSIRQSHCATPGGPVDGLWRFVFDNGSLFGTHFGTSAPTGTPGVARIDSLFTITGGTGYFGGATGMFDQVVFRDDRGPLRVVEGTFEGVLVVPEPALAALFGLAFAGLAVARRGPR